MGALNQCRLSAHLKLRRAHGERCLFFSFSTRSDRLTQKGEVCARGCVWPHEFCENRVTLPRSRGGGVMLLLVCFLSSGRALSLIAFVTSADSFRRLLLSFDVGSGIFLAFSLCNVLLKKSTFCLSLHWNGVVFSIIIFTKGERSYASRVDTY